MAVNSVNGIIMPPKNGMRLFTELFKHRRLFFLSFIVIFIVGLPWIFQENHTFFFKATYMKGFTRSHLKRTGFDTSETLIAQIDEIFIPEVKSKLSDKFPSVIDITVKVRPTSNPNLIEFESRISKNQAMVAEKLFLEVLDRTVVQQTRKFQAYKRWLQELTLAGEIAQKFYSPITKKIVPMVMAMDKSGPIEELPLSRREPDKEVKTPADRLVNQMDLFERLVSKVYELRKELATLKYQLSLTELPGIAVRPHLSSVTVGPQRNLKLMVTAALAFIGALAIVLSFFYVSRARLLIQEQGRQP